MLVGDSSAVSRDTRFIPPLSSALFPDDEDGELSSPRPLYIAVFLQAILLEPTFIRTLSVLGSVRLPDLLEHSSLILNFSATRAEDKHKSCFIGTSPDGNPEFCNGWSMQETVPSLMKEDTFETG